MWARISERERERERERETQAGPSDAIIDDCVSPRATALLLLMLLQSRLARCE